MGRALRTLAGARGLRFRRLAQSNSEAGPPDGSHLGQGLGDDVPGRRGHRYGTGSLFDLFELAQVELCRYDTVYVYYVYKR